MAVHFVGIIIGASTFLIIGLFHPLVIKAEYYIGIKVWPAFLILGLGCIIGALFIPSDLFSAIVAVTGFSLLWSIRELFDQKKRVEKGWFPANPKRKK